MITIKLTPEQYECMIHRLKFAQAYAIEAGLEDMKCDFQKLIDEIDIVDDAEIKKDDKS